jgi:serine/threonine protein kinase
MFVGRLPKHLDASELLVFTSEFMVGDTGLAHAGGAAQQRSMITVCGNTGFSAPEVWSGKRYTNACDAFSVGMQLATLL